MRSRAVAWLIALALLVVAFVGRGLAGGLTARPLAGDTARAPNPNADPSPSVDAVAALTSGEWAALPLLRSGPAPVNVPVRP